MKEKQYDLKTVKTDIIPFQQQFAKIKAPHELNLEAICIFSAIGFFLDQDTYWKDIVALPPASINTIDNDGILINSEPWFTWSYKPKKVDFNTVVSEFTDLFEGIINEQIGNKNVILPLSGGLDSRTQAVALNHLNKRVQSYSYSFLGGYPESKISKQIASVCNFDFNEYIIPKGYLWEKINELAKINNCYSDFTHPRQMAIIDEFDSMGDIFSLGHWGDVLFDRMCDGQLTEEEELEFVIKKILKKGGMELANNLWKSWQLEGEFEVYLRSRVKELLDKISIKDSNAKIRAFKSMYWAPRWTSINLAIFSEKKRITLPYYDNRMCQFICTIPEEYLADRKIQIAYIKNRSPKLARITWQENKPFNLYNYKFNKQPYNLPYRVINKLRREVNALIGNHYIQRNWELQFLGDNNAQELNSYLLNENFNSFVDEELVKELYLKFKHENTVKYSHPISMLLTLSNFYKSKN